MHRQKCRPLNFPRLPARTGEESHRFLRFTLLALLVWAPWLAPAQTRVPWTTSRIQGTPEPPLPFRVERAYPNLTFKEPLEVAPLPGSDRLVVIEHAGQMLSFVNTPEVDKAELFADLTQFHPEAKRCYAFTFHPKFAANRYIFTWLTLELNGKKNRPDGTLIVRFRVTESNPPKVDIASGKVIFTWLAGGHNGGNLRFGPDGMLYIATGDGGQADPPDELVSGQDLSNVLSSVLRIDVDNPAPDKAYSIPKDNPFLSVPKARGEVWAHGLRNPWRISFDPKSGELYAGDVGWELWEMIYRIKPGGNYGWSITEGGKQDVRPDRLRGPNPILPPLVAHSHEEAASITGGEFYHGKRLPELAGTYIYGDWQMGTFWALRAQGDKVTELRELCRSTLMPAGFGITPAGELLICDHGGGGLWQLGRNPEAGKPMNFPRKLSETGLFTSVPQHTPAPGVMPYLINAPRWADHASAERFIALPGTSSISLAEQSQGVLAKGRWVFPSNTVFAKTYTLELERGQPGSRRRVETQVLHYDGILWGAYSYRWNDAQTDAELVPARGDDTVFRVKDAAAPGGVLEQKWRFFSRVECLRCHNPWDNFAPGFAALQLDRTTAQERGRQLDAFARLGITPEEPKFADPFGPHGNIEIRARSYLHANCGTCHRFNGGGAVPVHLNIETALDKARLIHARPVQGDLGLPDGRVIAPGDPGRSVLLHRMATGGRGHMPYLGSKLVDERGLLLVRDWIASMTDKGKDVAATARSQREAEQSALKKLVAGDAQQIEPLLRTGSGALELVLALVDGSLKGALRDQVVARGSALVDPMRRDLFERFLPESQRRKVLGNDFKHETLLKLTGDATRGKALFAAVCAACHRAKGEGVDFGPDLSAVAKKWNRAGLIEQLLFPSKVIEPQWMLTTVELTNGESKSGFVTAQQAGELTLKMAGGETARVPAKQVKQTRSERVSLMPEGMLQALTAAEAADLLAFMGTLQ